MKTGYDVVGAIIAYESGEATNEGVRELFQHLVDTGMAWQLQGSYGRAAASLLDAGEINPPAGYEWTNGRLEKLTGEDAP